ncbi:hypothetical protein GJ699_13410 [Duganella sp. FT80W]|uniref:Uncharacterized protein n=1 Tax=Duganella guangzhouensis TaxID=2666084 RepID=A0A6I2KYB4_9BURK|nr:hypothetical protein [Duganella guangzhouensis]MRW90988.1 hypothetical protein [Duganella guangzhouensis]
MANKALATRQKMTMRIEPSQKAPRNPVALAAKQRAGGAGPHAKPQANDRHAAKQLLARINPKLNLDEQ